MHDIQYIYKQITTDTDLLYAWFTAMHTRIDIVMYGKSQMEMQLVTDSVYELIAQYEKCGEFFHGESELAKVNRLASHKPINISSELYLVIESALHFNLLTLGLFDIAVKSDNYSRSSISRIHLNKADSTVFFTDSSVKIDLSGFLKGYVLRLIKNRLKEHGIENALINAGNSSVLAMGNHPYGEGWKVGFSKQIINSESDENVVLHDECLTTSGNEDSERKHIINPYTNTYESGKRSVAVVTKDAAEGEALSTAMFVCDAESKDLIMRNFKAILLYF